MNRNANSRFAINPTNIDIQRSKFTLNNSVKTSFNVGQLIPFHVQEVLPGDSFNLKTSKVVRLQTLLTPVMDNIYLDTYFFFVPNRLVWEHWKEFCGENSDSAWIPETEYQIPQLVVDTQDGLDGFERGSLADYMGLPTGVPCSVSALPFRAYALIVNEWFRDQNLQDPVNVPLGDANQYYTSISDGDQTYINALANGGRPFVAAKFHDYFTSCLPSPQKGPDVMIPVAEAGLFPVLSRSEVIPSSINTTGLKWRSSGGSVVNPSAGSILKISNGITISSGDSSGSFEGAAVSPANLWADASGFSQATTINQLRLAFQVQKFYERAARGGTRYIEVLKSFFGVTSPDARLQRPEYLGGNRVPITINQVIQQSGTGAGAATPQGTTTGQSLTTDHHGDFVKSFTEHGFVIGLMVARYDHTYQQGIERHWSRKNKFDYYWPVFAHIGEQAVLRKEIFATGVEEEDEQVFGYQEAWADYRYKPSFVTGEMRSNVTNSLDVWHLADDYSSTPFLSGSWIQEDKTNVDRTLAVTSDVSDQIFCDVFVQNEATRPMPMFSIPGLIDHF